MKKVLFTLLISVSLLTYAKASETASYTINDQQVEQLFTNSTEVNYTQVSQNMLTAQSNVNLAENKLASMSGDKSATTALILCALFGGLGVHRMYLGTATFTWIGYILTCGGCGIVSTVDFWMLIINFKNVDQFVDNSKFFMW